MRTTQLYQATVSTSSICCWRSKPPRPSQNVLVDSAVPGNLACEPDDGPLLRTEAASSAGVSPSSAWVFDRFMTIGVRQLKTGLNKVMGRNLIARVSKTCGHRQADSGRIKPGSETVNNPDPNSFRPQNQRSRTQNPKQSRPQPPVERGWAEKADSRPPLRGPGGWGGDWYVWHAPDGLRARAATALGCVQAGAEKLGVIQASYASAITGVLSPVSSH